MRPLVFAGSLTLLLSSAAQAALPPGSFAPGALDRCAAPALGSGCGIGIADEAAVAAELLYAAMGTAAVTFATERAARLAENNEFEAAELWRRIAMAAAELASRRPREDAGR
jgi:hypothetical protein